MKKYCSQGSNVSGGDIGMQIVSSVVVLGEIGDIDEVVVTASASGETLVWTSSSATIVSFAPSPSLLALCAALHWR